MSDLRTLRIPGSYRRNRGGESFESSGLLKENKGLKQADACSEKRALPFMAIHLLVIIQTI
jgi:hypothetical protein